MNSTGIGEHTAPPAPTAIPTTDGAATSMPPRVLTVKAFGVPLGHSRLNELVEKVTASLKLTVMLVFTATLVAPLVGTVVVTAGVCSAVGMTRASKRARRHVASCSGQRTKDAL